MKDLQGQGRRKTWEEGRRNHRDRDHCIIMNGQGVLNLQIDSTTSFGFEISWSVIGAWDYYVISASLESVEEAPGYPKNSTSTSAQLIHLYPDTAYDIQVQPKLNNGEEGQLDTTSGTTDVSRIEVMVRSETFISVAYTLPEDQPSSNQQIRLGHFGSTLQIFGSQPANNIGNIIFDSFPAVSPGDLLYASNAPSSDPTNYLNEIHFRYPSSPPQNVMVNPSPGDAFEVTFDLPATGGNYDGFKIRVNDEVRETLMGSATTSVIINSLAPNTLYTFNVTSFVGIGGDEAESEIFTDTRILGSSMPDITVLNTTESSIALGLQPGHGVLDEYIITIQCMDATQDHCVCEEEHRVPGNAKTFVIDDLRPNVEYGISVVAWAGSELAETSEEVTLEQRTLSIPNNRFTVLDQTPDSVILAWTVSGPANITMERLMPSGYVLNATYVYDGCFSSNVLEVSGLEPVTIYRFTMPDDVSILIRTDPPSIESCSVETTSSGYTFTWSALAPGSNDGYQVTVTDSQGGLVQEEAVPPTDNPEVVKIRVPPETELTLAVISRLAADDTNNFPQQFGAVPCIQNAVTKSLVAGEVSPTNVTVNEIPFVVGNASALEGFEAYAFAVEPPGPVISFNEDSLTGVYSNVIPGQLYTITSTIVGTDVTFTLTERAKPLPPVDGSSPSAGVTSVRLQWGTPSGIVTFYRVTINPTLDTDQNFIEVTNLLPGTDYNVSIVAISGTGLYQQISDPIEFQVITDNLTTGELVFVDVTSSSMTAIWPDSGSPPYTPDIQIGTETNKLTPPSPDGNMLIVTNGVKASQIYHFIIYDNTFQVVANNSVRTNPETPQPPILTSVGPFSLSFEWAPTNTTFSSYRMYYVPFSFRRELVSTIPNNSSDLTYSQGCLRPNTEYVFEVETVLDAADGFGEQTSDSAQSISITTRQYDNNEPHVSSTNNTNLQVIWLDAATNGQQVCLKELCSTLRGDTPMCLPTNQTCPLFYTFEGLVPGRRYVVFVEYNDGTMEDVIFTQTKPNPPESLSASALGSDEIRVLLSPPQGEFDGYELSFSPSAGGPILLEPDTREHLLYNLQSVTTYNIQVFAYSGSNGQRLEGDAISTTATTDKEILVATNIETDQIFILWSTDTDMLDVNSFQRFRLSYSSMVSDSILIPKNAMSTSNEYGHSVTDLVPGDLVTFNLETVTLSGQATLVDTIVRQIKPEMVSVFEGQTDSSTSIRLMWRAPSVGLYRGYLVSYSPANGDQSSPIELGPDEEELTITGLQFNQMYDVSIRSIMGQEGTYVESDPAFEMVTTGEGEENEVNIRDLTSTSVSFTWWGTGSVESPIGLMPIGSCMAEEPPEQEVTSRAATFDDLMPGARYAISGIGGDNAEFIAVPDQVSNIVVKFINSSAVTFSWMAPSGCYDRIEISYAPDTCTNPSPIVLNHDEGNEYTLTLLQANEEYQLSFVTLQMTARSEPYVASVRTTCPEKEKLNVGSVQADSISLTWGNTTQATATGFTLVATPESSTPIIRELDLSLLEYTFDGLMSGVEYTVVLYVNGTAITDTVTQTTCPSEAQNVTVIFSTQTCLTFAWLPPEGNFHSYEVFVRHGNPPVFVLERTVYPDDDLNVLVENLDASTLYTIGVVTVVDGFKGMPALAIQRTTDNLVMTSTVAGDSQAVTVSWQRPDGADYFNLVYIPDNGDMANSDLTNLTDLSVTIGSLTPGKRYVFILSVHDMDGQSALLAQTSYTLRPERPLILDVMSSVTIAAMAVTAQEGVYETYKISISPSGRTFQGDRAALIFQYISGLEPDTDYIATVTFKTGDEEAEADYEFETNPLRMDQLYSDEVTTDSIGLVWEVIPDTDTYAIQLDDRLFFTLETSYVLTGLKAGTEYSPTLLVRKTGMTELDNVDTTAIYTLPEPVLFFEVKEIIDNNVTFVWSGPSSDFDGYGLAIAPPIVNYRISLDEKEITIQVNTNKEFLASIYTYAGPWSSEPSTLNIIIDPREPGTIDVEEVTSTSISITWTEIAGITNYIVNLILASNNTKLFSGVIRSSLKASFSGLMPGEEYIIKIGLQCPGEVLSLRQFTLPLEPVCAVFTWVTEDSVTLQWSRPESQLFGYEIMYDDGSGPYSPINVFDRNSLQLERTIMGLMDGPGVEVNITTLAGAGMTQTRSNPVKISPSSLGSAFNITTVTSTSIAFGWYDLPDASEYDVCIQQIMGNATCRNVTEKTTEFSDLFPGAAYTFSLGWESACGVTLTFNTVPISPANLSLGSISSCAGQVTWDIPESEYDFFEVTYSPDHGFTNSPAPIYRMDINENQTRVEFSFIGILPDTNYNVTVVTVVGALDVRSEPSYISFRTESPANGSVAVTALSADSIQVGWGNNTQDYVNIRFNLDGENQTVCENEFICAVGNGSEFFNINDLQSGRKYHVFIDQDGVCGTLQQYTRPLPPVNIETADSQLTSLLIAWSDPGNETMFDRYYVAYERADELGNFTEVGYLYPNVTSIFLEGLTPRTEYLFNVSTVVGEGKAQAFSDGELYSAYTAEANGTVTVFEYDTTSIMFTWPNMTSDLNVSISIIPNDGALDLNIGNRSAQVTGLVPGRLYNISVLPFETIFQRTKPLPPYNVSICPDVGETFFSFCVRLTPPTGDYDAFYVLTMDDFQPVQERRKRSPQEFGFDLAKRLGGNELETVLDDLVPDTGYTVQAVTVSGAGSMNEECSAPVETIGRTLMIGETELVFTKVNSTAFRVWWNRDRNFTGNYNITALPSDQQMLMSHDSIPFADFEGVLSSTVYNVLVETGPSGSVAAGSVRTDPDSVSNVFLTSLDEITLIASWDPPDVVTSSNEILLTLSTNSTEVRSVNVSGNVTEFVFKCLEPETEYTVELVSLLQESGSFEKQYATETPPTATNSTVGLRPANESTPVVDSLTSTSIAVRWGRLGQAGYSVCLVEYCRQRLDDPVCLTNNSDLCSIEGEFDSLDPGQLYIVSYMDPYGVSMELEKVRTRPSPPSSVTITAVSSRLIEIRWTPPPNIAEMVLEYFETESPSNTWEARIDNDGMYDIHGLDADTSYTVRLSSVGRTGAGDGSDGKRLSGEPLEEVVRTSARILSVVNTANALTFLWDEQPNPETFTGYLITSASINEVIPKQSEETSYQKSISNLTPGQLYEVSLFLQPITTFPAPLDQLQVRTAPSPPESLRVVDETITTLRIEWDSPASGLYRGFEVNISPPTALQELPRIVGSDIRGFTFVGLMHNTEYTVSVTTIMGEEGLEERSTTAEKTVMTARGDGDEVYLLSVSSTDAQIGWTIPPPTTVYLDGKQITVLSQPHTIPSLTPGRQYTFTVEDVDLAFTTVPERPDGLELESVGPYSLDWKVDTSLNDLNYERLEVSYSPESSQTDSPFDISRCTDGTFTLEGLQPDTEYSVSVTAISGDTRSDILTRYGFTTCALEGQLHVVSLSSDEIALAWGPVNNIQGYAVRLYNAIGNNIMNLSPSADTLSATLVSLSPASNYSVQLFVMDTDGSRQTSVLQFVTDPAPPGPITLQSSTQTRLSFTWTPASSNFDSYELSISGGDMPEPRPVGVVYPNEENEFEVGGLLPDTTYNVRIYSVFSESRSIASEASFNTDEQILEFNVGSNQNLTVSWQVQEGAESYRLIYTTTNRNTNSIARPATSTSITIDNLLFGAIYNFRLATIAADGTEMEVANADFVQSPLTPSTNISDIKATTALLTFSLREGIFDDYVVMLSSPTDSCGARQPVFTLSREACPELLLLDLYPNTMYTAQVFARTGERGLSLPSETTLQNFTTATVVNNEVEISKVGTNSLEIIWKTDNVDEYLLHYSGPDGPLMSDIVPYIEINYYTFGELMPGTQYSISVISLMNRERQGDALEVMQYTKPDPISNLVLTPQENTINLTWTSPSTMYDGFLICWYSATTEDNKAWLDGDATTYPWVISTPNEEYVVSVATFVGDREGDYVLSNKVTDFITLTETSPLILKDIATDTISVSWVTIPGVVDYTLSYSPPDGNEQATQDIDESSAIAEGLNNIYYVNFTGLTPGREYTFTVVWPLAFNYSTDAIRTNPLPIYDPSVTNTTSCNLLYQWCLPDSDFDNISITIVPDVSMRTLSRGNGTGGMCDYQTVYLDGLEPATSYNVSVEVMSGDKSSEVVMVYSTTGDRGGAITVTDVSTTSLNITWSEVPGEDEFTVQWTVASGDPLNATVSGAHELSIGNLQPGDDVHITVAWDFLCLLPFMRQYTKPLPVNNVTLDDSTIFTLTISWENPIDGSFNMFLVEYAPVRSPDSVMALDPINMGTNTAIIPNLQPGTLYNIMVYALAGEERSDATEITAMTRQQNSEELRLQTRTSTSISVSWGNTTRPEVTGFVLRITFQEGDAIDSIKNVSLGDVLGVEFSDLIPGTNYTVYLLVEVEGQSDTAVHSLDVTTLPGMPGNISCDPTKTTQSLLEIEWGSTQEGNFDGYAISTQTGDGEEIPLESVEKDEQLQATADYLMDNTIYTFIVRSTLGDLRGEPTTMTCRTHPQNLMVSTSTSPSGGQDLFLDWQDYGASSYKVEYTPQEGTPSSPIFLDTSQLILRNLSPGTAYHFTLHYTATGSTTGVTFVLAPLPVVQVIIVLRRPTSFTIQITLPRRGRYRFLRLRVRRRSQGLDAGPDGDEFLIPTDACPEYTFNNLLPDTDYAVDLNTVGEDGRTESSPSTIDVTTPRMEEGDISFNEVTTTSISFSWGMVSADTNGPFDFYLLNLKNELSIDVQNVQVNTSETREHTFIGLMPGELYRVELIVNSNRQRSAPMYTRPDKPTDIMLSDLTTTSLTIDWKAPLTSYQGFRLCWAYGETNSLELGPAVMERTLSDLEAGAEYLVSLAAVVGTGTNQITSEKFTTIVTLFPPAELHVNITSFNTTAVSIVWGTDITLLDVSSYVVSYWETANNGSVEDISVEDPSQTDYTIDGLVPGTRYSFMVDALGTVQAVTSIGATQYTNPETVAEIRVIPSITCSVRLEWDRPEGNLDSYIFHYNVTRGTIVGAPLQLDVAINDTAETLTYLLEGLEKDSSSDFVSLEVGVTTVAGAGEDQVESLQQVVKDLDVNVVTITILGRDQNSIQAEVNSSVSNVESITTGLYIDEMVTSSTTRNCSTTDCESFTVDFDTLNSGTLYTLYAGVVQSSGREVVPLLAKAATIPESAVDLQFTSIGRNYVVLTWNNPAGMIDSYNISYYPVDDITKLMFEVVQAAAESNVLRVDDLNEGMNYSFTVVSLLEVEADLQEMGAPVEVFAVVGVLGSLNITAFDETTISIEWEQVDVEEYILSYDALEGGSGNVTVQSTDPNSYTFTGLTPGTQYTIGVQPGIYAALEKTQSTVPNPPTNLRTTMVAAQSITVSWDPPSEGGSDTYNITYNVTGGQPPSPHTVSTSETSVTFSNLTPLTEYFFTIVNIWKSLPSRSELTRATTSAQTLSLAVTPEDNTEFTVSWEDLDTEAFEQYCVMYEPYEAQENRQQESFPVARNIRSARFYGLDPGQEYTVYVTSCSSVSDPTSHANERISFRLDPADIAEIRIMDGSLGPRAVMLEWDQPEGIRGLYEVTLDPADEGSVDRDELPVNITGVMTSIKILNLAAGKGYTVGITAISGDKRSENTTFLFYTLPDPPQNLILSEIGEDTARLSWADPAEMNFAIVDVVMTTMPATKTTILNLDDTNTVELTNLVPGQTYTVQLASVIRPDDALNQPEVIGEPQVSSPFLMKPASPSDISVSNNELTRVTVTWQPSEGVVARYSYTYGLPGSTVTASETTTTTDTSIQLSNLTPSTRYEFRLWAESDQTEGSETSSSDVVTVNIVTKPYSPSFTGSEVMATSITWTWSSPSTIVTNFVISIKDDTGANINTQSVQEGLMSYTEENLASYTIYDAVLQAVFFNVPSDPVALAVRTLPSMPSAVGGLTITKTGIVDAEVSWSSPLLPNGVIANYSLTIHISHDNGTLSPYGDTVTISAVAEQTEYSQDVIGLAAGQYYVFSVYATNQVASSNQRSTTRTLFAETAPPTPPRGATPLLVSRGSTITITFSNLFDTAFGRIVRFAIIVQERVDGGTVVITAKRQTTSTLTWAEARRTRPVPSYQTTPDDYNPFADGAGVTTFRVGSESCDPDDLTAYCNGALYPGTSYRFAIRAYGVDGKFVDTEFSSPFRTDPDRGIFVIPAIVLAIMVVIILIIFMAMGFGCCGKPDDGMYSDDSTGYGNDYGNGNGYSNGNGNGIMKRALINDGVNTYAYQQPQIMEHSFTNIPDYSTIPPNRGTTAQVHQPSTTHTRPTKKNMFAQHVAKMSARNNAGFSDEYNNLPAMEKTRAVTAARQARNDDKNRYRNILPYDYTRVQLKGVAGTDYINASYIKDDHGQKKYIATQGPLPNTIEHFWEMVWENQTSTIVMMTALVEGGKTKCEHYWPAGEEPQLHGNVTVTLVGSNQTENFIERTLLLEKEGTERTVTHYQYLAWTDHGVPESTAPLVGLLRQVKVTNQEDGAATGPIVVHCSAGVGRTGTFIAADMLMDAIQRSTATDYIDVAGTIAKIREQRALLVQTLYQYIYLHRTVLSLIEEQ